MLNWEKKPTATNAVYIAELQKQIAKLSHQVSELQKDKEILRWTIRNMDDLQKRYDQHITGHGMRDFQPILSQLPFTKN
jgi:hypothetical protein